MIKWHKLGAKEDKEKDEFGSGESNVLTIKGGINPMEAVEMQLGPFNRWAVCTDFDITADQVTLINNTDGVESLDPVSRYRLKFIIGDCFNENVVKRTVDDILAGNRKVSEHKNFMMAEMAGILGDMAKKWAIVESEGRPAYFYGSVYDDDWSDNLLTTLKHAANELNTTLLNN